MRIGTDKWAHYGLSAVAVLIFHIILSQFMQEGISAGAASSVVLLGGFVKEYLQDEKPEVMDLVADVLGVITAILIIILL